MQRRALWAVLVGAALLAWWFSARAPVRPTKPSSAEPPDARLKAAAPSAYFGSAPSLGPVSSATTVMVTGRVTARRDPTWDESDAELPSHSSPQASNDVVAGAEVVFMAPDGEHTALTDSKGNYRVALPPGPYHVYARGEGIGTLVPPANERLYGLNVALHGAEQSDRAPLVTIFGQQQTVQVAVVRTGTVRGRVTTQQGDPVSDVYVGPVGGWVLLDGTQHAQSDASGTFELTLPEGFASLIGLHHDRGETEPANTDVHANRVAEATLILPAQCVVRGSVIRADGSPTGAGAIELYDGPPGTIDLHAFFGVGRIQDDGTFSFAMNETKEITLRAWPWKSSPSPPQTFACRPGQTFRDVVFRLPNTAPDVFGSLHYDDGRPLAFGMVDVLALSPGGISQQERADENGEWAVYHMPAGRYRIMAYAQDGGVVSQEVTVPSGPHDFVLSGMGMMRGRALGVTDGQMTVFYGCNEANSDMNMEHVVQIQNGRYELAVPACDVALRIDGPEGRQQWANVTVAAGQAVEQDLDLREPTLVTVKGRVVDERGGGVAGAQLFATGVDATPSVTKSDGSFSMQILNTEPLVTAFVETGCLLGESRVVDGADVVVTVRPQPEFCDDHSEDDHSEDEGAWEGEAEPDLLLNGTDEMMGALIVN